MIFANKFFAGGRTTRADNCFLQMMKTECAGESFNHIWLLARR